MICSFMIPAPSVLLIGVVFIFDGLLQGISSVQIRRGTKPNGKAIRTILTLFLGSLFVMGPQTGVRTFLAILAGYYLITGCLRIIVILQYPLRSGREWILIHSMMTMVLGGILIFFIEPASVSWEIGLFIGIELIFRGGILLALTKKPLKKCQTGEKHSLYQALGLGKGFSHHLSNNGTRPRQARPLSNPLYTSE